VTHSPVRVPPDLLEEYVRRDTLDLTILAQLVLSHQDTLALISSGAICSIDRQDIAPAMSCGEVDLAHGSTWAEVVAAALDAQQGTTNHLRALVCAADAAGIELKASKELR
jgi:hypothetical protein